MGIILWIIAEVLSKFFNLVGLSYSILFSLITLKWVSGLKRINQYFYQLALSKDQHVNVAVQDLFNSIMLKNKAIKFGSEDHTLSYYFAVNRLVTTKETGLNLHGQFWAFIIDLFEYRKGGHLKVALKSVYESEMKLLFKYDHAGIDFQRYKQIIKLNFFES